MATSTAAIQPARVPHSPAAAQHATGTASSMQATDSQRTASSELPATRHPDVQQHVVERRRAVEPQRLGDVAERAVGDPDRQPLVDPEADPQLARAQDEREQDERGETGRDRELRA